MGSLKRPPKSQRLISPDASKGFREYEAVPKFVKSLETVRKPKKVRKRRVRLRTSSIETRRRGGKSSGWSVQGGLPTLGKR